tara:strand:+ start:18883 stop:19194 length:312 start_codon:yes stop_codon:yes gene_type:complete
LDKKKFIKQIQQVCINESVEHDIKFLSTGEPASFSDLAITELAQLLQSCDQKTKDTIEKLMYFTSKNSVAGVLHLIDMQFTLQEKHNELHQTNLLDLFLNTKQ